MKKTALPIALLLLLTACQSGQSAPESPATITESPAPYELTLGQTFEIPYTGSVTVIQQTRTQTENKKPLLGIEVQSCADQRQIPSNGFQERMSLIADDGSIAVFTRYTSDDESLSPKYPSGNNANEQASTLEMGRCTVGWMFAEITTGTTPREVMYAGNRSRVLWRLNGN